MNDLERRVQVLEEECQILKNQIHATLLMLQEAVLTNAYPALRAQDGSPQPPEVPQPVKQVRLSQDPAPSAAPPEQAAVVQQIRPQAQPPLAEIAQPEPRQAPASVPGSDNVHPNYIDWDRQRELEAWAEEQVTRFGIARTATLIGDYAQQGHFSSAEQAALAAFLSYFEEPKLDDSTAQFIAGQAEAQQADQPAAVRPFDPLWEDLDSRYEDEQVYPRYQRNQRAQPAPDDDAPRNMVLRLIAGIQNAGAGIEWRKGNG
ncbi:MAG: hypothetical protein ACLFTK_02740 [Anaerolineales bacterium]